VEHSTVAGVSYPGIRVRHHTRPKMKITRIETIPVQVPLKEQLSIRGSRGWHRVSPFLVVRVHTDEGLVGLGEVSCTPIWSGEDHATAAHFIDTLISPVLLGTDPTELERICALLEKVVAGNPFTKAGIEMALWDILGKIANLPLYRLLGGPVREFIPTKWSISGEEPGRAAEIALWAKAQGFQTMKVKVGLNPGMDLERVRAVRRAIGSQIRLGVDANGGWSPCEAVQTTQRLADQDILFVEQPVHPFDVTGMADIRRRVQLPVMADESLYTLRDAMELVRAGAADIFSIYVGKSGGIGPARKIAAVAEAAGIRCTVGSNLEMGIASAAMIHLAMATSAIDADAFPCDIIGPLCYQDDLLINPLSVVPGKAFPPQGPGLGVELDNAKLEKYRVRLA
jgi:L-alanine-DL-glutamate epimerase-like enolase superfamily enzyme